MIYIPGVIKNSKFGCGDTMCDKYLVGIELLIEPVDIVQYRKPDMPLKHNTNCKTSIRHDN